MSVTKTKHLRIITLVLLVILFNSEHVFANNLKEIVNLKGYWKFSVGDNPEWKNPDFNDTDWERHYVPRSWESNGYKGYNGFAWYRTEFDLYSEITDESYYLSLGLIDDADEVYLNGHFIGGFGNMPPEVSTAFNIQRKYEIPLEYLNFSGPNYIAVRVYDYYNDGGIVSGALGLYKVAKDPLLDVNLAGFWFFEAEDDVDLEIKKQKNQVKSKIFVPAYWEDHGYPNYNGNATYTTQFRLPEKSKNKELFLVLGFIDDIDQVYLNGNKIGSVKALKKSEGTNLPYHRIFRGYAIPNELLKKDADNRITVVVYDEGGGGGIYEGPIGIATKENYELLKQRNATRKSPWDLFIESFGF